MTADFRIKLAVVKNKTQQVMKRFNVNKLTVAEHRNSFNLEVNNIYETLGDEVENERETVDQVESV